ncbi:hypothetical protein HPB52_025189 [Rhipicephalus sanguineus]|uniref:Uncharacterized protein n=1 Tax=Rhipicephalus sanguineus TaxID=34632 RepID=A0A9D4YRQ2_RHISA|nr:hypothetical protein HPB52_025189 [Rhipicephalus sanguineus]
MRVSCALLRQHLRELMTTDEPHATMDDFYLLLTVMLCNLSRVRGSNLNREWFQNRANDLVALFPTVSGPPPVPLYCEAQADAIPTLASSGPTPGRHSAAPYSRTTLKCVPLYGS